MDEYLFKCCGVVALSAHLVFLRIAYEEDRTWFFLIFACPPLGWFYALRSDCDTPRLPAICSFLTVVGYASYAFFTYTPIAVQSSGPDLTEVWERRTENVAKATRVYISRYRKVPRDTRVLVSHRLLQRRNSVDPAGNQIGISVTMREIVVGPMGEETDPRFQERTFPLRGP